MGRPIGSRNGHSSTSKPVNSNSKTFINGRKTTQKLNAVGKLTNGTNDGKKNFHSTPNYVDKSQLNFPFDIRINGFSSLLNTVKKASTKVKKLILDECDVILECRVCKNLFRSLPNYLSHKQLYCKKEYSPLADSSYCQFIQKSPASYDFNYHVDESLIESVINSTKNLSTTNLLSSSSSSTRSNNNDSRVNIPNNNNNNNIYTSNSRINGTRKNPINVDPDDKKVSRLHEIITRLAPAIENASRTPSEFYSDIIVRKNIGGGGGGGGTTASTTTSNNNNVRQDTTIVTNHNNNIITTTRKAPNQDNLVHVLFEPIEDRSLKDGIVFQKKIEHDPSNCDVFKDERCVLEPDSAVLGPDGKILCVGDSVNVEKIVNRIIAQVEVKQEEQKRLHEELNCPHCLTMFPTRKFLRMHIRAAHRSSPDEENQSDDKNSVELDTQAVSQEPIVQDIYSTPTKKPKLQDDGVIKLERETSPDIVDWKPSSSSAVKSSSSSSTTTTTATTIPNSIVKSSPPKIIRNMQPLFSLTPAPRRKRGRPPGRKNNKTLSSNSININNIDDRQSTNNNSRNDNNNNPKGTDLSRRLSISDSSDSGELYKSTLSIPFNRNMDDNTSTNTVHNNYEKSTNFQRNLNLLPNLHPAVGNFYCVKCSANFSTKSEMSLHLTTCAGAINLALLRCPKSPEHKKISILVRNDYGKATTNAETKDITTASGTIVNKTSRINNIISQNTSLKKNRVNNVHSNNTNNNNHDEDELDEKFDWTRWEPNTQQSSNNLFNDFDECMKVQNTLSNKNYTVGHEIEVGDEDDDDDEEEGEEEDEEEEEEEGDEDEEEDIDEDMDERSGASDSDDGLHENEKTSNNENDGETYNSNTDSGLSNTGSGSSSNVTQSNQTKLNLKPCTVNIEIIPFQNLKES